MQEQGSVRYDVIACPVDIIPRCYYAKCTECRNGNDDKRAWYMHEWVVLVRAMLGNFIPVFPCVFPIDLSH